jgi:putative phosphoribosyl transferase
MNTRQAPEEIPVALGDRQLPGVLAIPNRPIGIVIFAHGSGSSRLSPRNRSIASHLHRSGIATLLFDLLTEPEAEDRRNVFDMDLLAERLMQAIAWIQQNPQTSGLKIGLFGASTGAAAALIAAAHCEASVSAVVSRGGRPDLADQFLPRVKAPTLLIVGGNDSEVLALNQSVLAELRSEAVLKIVPGATHLFSEPGKMEVVAELACEWFEQHLSHSPISPACSNP